MHFLELVYSSPVLSSSQCLHNLQLLTTDIAILRKYLTVATKHEKIYILCQSSGQTGNHSCRIVMHSVVLAADRKLFGFKVEDDANSR